MEGGPFQDIFNDICQLTTNKDFVAAQTQFMEQHAGAFELGEEENKLEHTTIHEKYIYILE